MNLDGEERNQLAATIGCAPTDLTAKLNQFAAAAEEEYVQMLLGNRVYTRGAEIKEYRLYLLVKHVFGMRLPGAETISAMFKVTPSQARGMLRSVLAKFDYELKAAADATVADVLAAGHVHKDDQGKAPDKQRWWLTITNENVVEEINSRIRASDAELEPLAKVAATSAVYLLTPAAYKKLMS